MRNPPILRFTLDNLQTRSGGYLPELVGFKVLTLEQGRLTARLPIEKHLLAPNGYLHAATVIALADTACGFGTIAHLPEGAQSFTTIELKCNFIGTVRDGGIACEATVMHAGRTTQVWDATVTDEATGNTVALFRCTQMILWPKP